MKQWSEGDLIELERVAAKCGVRVEDTIEELNRPSSRLETWQARERIRQAELTADALREFVNIKRSGCEKKSAA